ncbi:hypothetical protein ABZV52_16355 [Streptomyces sp. NPDC004735]|uniref:hypothetical protein n=1 Tax=Streptomyces sp. NPDC004735 TaxID=3156654 RepID=UPI0033A067D1
MPTTRVPDPGPPAGQGAAHQTPSLAAMLFAVSMTFIDQTIVAIAAPSIVDELGLTSSGTQWAVNACLLAPAAFFALGGRRVRRTATGRSRPGTAGPPR